MIHVSLANLGSPSEISSPNRGYYSPFKFGTRTSIASPIGAFTLSIDFAIPPCWGFSVADFPSQSRQGELYFGTPHRERSELLRGVAPISVENVYAF